MALDKEKLQEEADQRRTNASASKKLVKVKKQYKDVDDYINTYEPLIFEEAKAQIIRGKEEENGAEWKLGVVQSYKESDDFDFIEYVFELEEGESISQNDMLLISKNERFEDILNQEFFDLDSI
ncbi:hypothetical protein TSUD_21030 [Trifolium subterraneum]|uniref:Uncharacterized protein n=1 Tax=Trifolium subterraneum TaxID=3900 RepID=A0A2Z6NAZ5_TRISU|nr:hypothetical protein TSUD_21030 [Trifolium subterraneum]